MVYRCVSSTEYPASRHLLRLIVIVVDPYFICLMVIVVWRNAENMSFVETAHMEYTVRSQEEKNVRIIKEEN